MSFSDLIDHILDDKYKIESELGRGGMGTVYLATHLGTERPVALKVIAPQFMERPEFVERFSREARAAGRLRHPNVVNVTDYGYSSTVDGNVAYIVMEYLDGCTLGEILEEEQNLPVSWTLDILEQVSSAVQAAHEQGIIHRDLKPDNIWLEPNQRGGYTVKVLDFGIAKLEESVSTGAAIREIRTSITPTGVDSPRSTIADGHINEATLFGNIPATIADGLDHQTAVMETVGADVVSIPDPEGATAIFLADPDHVDDEDVVRTRLMSESAARPQSLGPTTPVVGIQTADLTRAGAVLGTPLYMSPEQCSGEKLDARSDIYSLGVIAYQMLAGHTPFGGDFTAVMAAHKNDLPPRLEAKKVRKKLKKVIYSAMAKSADDRPQSAEAFASLLRSRSEGIYMLLRRALMIYTEQMPKFLILSAFFSMPMIVLTLTLILFGFLKIDGIISAETAYWAIGINSFALTVISAFSVYLIVGTITWIVTQFLAVPLRPIKLRLALKEARTKWQTFAGTGILSIVLSIGIGIVTCGIGFLVVSVWWMLLAPVVMMENLKGREALRRSKELVKRSLLTSVAALVIMFLIPAVSAGLLSFVLSAVAGSLRNSSDPIVSVVNDGEVQSNVEESNRPNTPNLEFNIGKKRLIKLNDKEPKDMQTQLVDAVFESLLQILLLPIQIVVYSFSSIIVALLYLKTRQAGGESMQDLMTKFEESEFPRKKWQERVRQRLIQSGRITSKP
ncbi:MAG: serine/threonine-protein kinase [Pyrinomonadaceae bacterium]